MTEGARPSRRAAPVKLPLSTTARKTEIWSKVGVLGSIYSINSNSLIETIPVFRTGPDLHLGLEISTRGSHVCSQSLDPLLFPLRHRRAPGPGGGRGRAK